MHDTSPPILSPWSGLPAPECCLANKSPARMSSERLQSALEETLSRRLNGLGSMIYSIGWKQHVTPLGRAISRLRASAPRTSAKERSSEPSVMSGWMTPTVGNASGSQNDTDSRWQQRREECKARHGNNGFGLTLGMASTLAGWSTASARDWKDTAGMATESVNPDGSTRTRLDQLPRQAQMAGWPTARAADGEKNVRTAEGALSEIARKGSPQDLAQGAVLAGWPTAAASDGIGGKGPRQGVSMSGRMPDGAKVTMDLSASVKLAMDREGPARFTVSGEMLTGCSAGMESGGQLNPDLSRWLMGYPAEWGSCGATAMQSIRTRRPSSSGRSRKQSMTSAGQSPMQLIYQSLLPISCEVA